MSEIREYRKKPVVIQAMQLTKKNVLDVCSWCDAKEWDDNPAELKIKTLEGVMTASEGDYIICGVNGEYYPCKPDIFAKTYDDAHTPPATPDAAAQPVASSNVMYVEVSREFVEYVEKHRDEIPPVLLYIERRDGNRLELSFDTPPRASGERSDDVCTDFDLGYKGGFAAAKAYYEAKNLRTAHRASGETGAVDAIRAAFVEGAMFKVQNPNASADKIVKAARVFSAAPRADATRDAAVPSDYPAIVTSDAARRGQDDARDAARYRFLRSLALGQDVDAWTRWYFLCDAFFKDATETFDKRIDAALRARDGEGGA